MSDSERVIRIINRFFLSFLYLTIATCCAQAQGLLFNQSAVDTGNSPLPAIVQEFNGDGRADLQDLSSNNTVSIMLGQANATFAPAVSYEIGNSPYTFIASSLRKGNKIDLIIITMPNGVDSPGTVSVLLGNGDGTLAPHVDYEVGDYPTVLSPAILTTMAKSILRYQTPVMAQCPFSMETGMELLSRRC